MTETISDHRPAIVVGVVGTATDVGKTWVASAVLDRLRTSGLTVSARKPVQTFEAGAAVTDASLLASATGEPPEEVCPRHRWYPLPMAPPIAAQRLGRSPIALHDLVAEVVWPSGAQIGFVETVGGVRSPLADDGDSAALIGALAVDHVILVADAGLGAINAVRLAVDTLTVGSLTVVLNRFDAGDAVHESNRHWLTDRDRLPVVTDIDDCASAIHRLMPVGRSARSGKLTP